MVNCGQRSDLTDPTADTVAKDGLKRGLGRAGGVLKGISSNDLDEIATLVETNKIKFYDNAIIYLGGCNVGTAGDIINPSTNESEYIVFAQKLADVTGAVVIAANDQVIPKKEC